jgi:protein involved in polysaccharide export with SLBB domain
MHVFIKKLVCLLTLMLIAFAADAQSSSALYGRHIFAGNKQQFFAASSQAVTRRFERVRTLQVSVAGEVSVPGTYEMPSTSTMLDALYHAGGINSLGSLRTVYLLRSGRRVASMDIYDLLMKGKDEGTARLQEGDIVWVPPFETRVRIEGLVNRPMQYELKKGECLDKLLQFAGGFSHDAYMDHVGLVRLQATGRVDYTVDEREYGTFVMEDGDAVQVSAMKDRYANRIEIKGAVMRPGVYELGEQVHTASQLIAKADGLMDEAFVARAVIHRTHENLYHEVISLDVEKALAGTADVELEKNDVVYIPSIHDLEDLGNVSIAGDVARPGSFAYAENMTVEDLVVLAGGLQDRASTSRVDVFRRLKDAASVKTKSEVGEMYTFSLEDSLSVNRARAFALKPYDQVHIRRSPGSTQPCKVYAAGQLLYAGTYMMTQRDDRLSDLVARAGGYMPDAYPEGAMLARHLSADERARSREVQTLNNYVEGAEATALTEMYYVGIDLKEAVANPGSESDLPLREGDVLYIPKYSNTVRVEGAVEVPSVMPYRSGLSIRNYIDKAGGYTKRARKSRTYVFHVNGRLEQVKHVSKHAVEPGCEIVVLSKRKHGELSTAELKQVQSNARLLQRHTTVIMNTLKD